MRASGLAAIQREVAEIERQAVMVRTFQPMVIPGLVQTAEVARQIFAAEEPDRPDIAEAVATRMERQTLLYNPSKRFEFVVTEAALRYPWGPPPVQAAQLDRLRQALTLSTVTLGILPLDAEMPMWRYHGFNLFELADEEALVIVGLLGRNFTSTDPEDTARYRAAFERLMAASATGTEARAILDRLAR